MKKKYILLVLLAMGWFGSTAMAEDYLMPQYGHETKVVSKDAPLTFYDFKGADTHFTQSALSTVIFQPATEGYSIKITFEELNLTKYSDSWNVYMRIYNGQFDVTSITYPTSGNPSVHFTENANQIAYIPGDGAVNPLPTYISGAADGCLSVCLYSKDPSPKESYWKATVEEVLLEPMTIQSASGDNAFVSGEGWSGKANVNVADMHITTDGYSLPDKLQTVTFTCSNTAVVDPTTLKLYAGAAASVAELTELAGSITENEGVYTYTLSEAYALSHGTNQFCLGGNILVSAPFNATAAVNITGITTVGGFSTFTPAEPAMITVQPMYLMAADAAYTVSGETQFYDEGGKDGNVIKGFDGKVVFTPATEGSKIKLTFNAINVFYTDYAASSTGYVDYIKVYNGNSTNEADLLWQISQAEASTNTPIVLKSTAANGALTITHKNNISYDSNLRDGWEAVVSEFTPQAMTVSNVSLTKETGTVSAGTENAILASLKITTAETEPALSVASLALNTNATYNQIQKAKLYYTKQNSFATTNLIGEAVVEGNEVTITKSADIAFREGDNYLWLVCDIQALAINDQQVNVTLSALSFTNGTTISDFGNQTGLLTIKNVAIQACGTQTFTVLGEWQYTHTVTNEYSSKYMYEQCDQTVIFKPATAGNVIQIDYSDFDVYYGSSSYSTRAKYIVYAGEGTSGDILWQLDANGKQPTQIRSTAANGALTIVFNPNTTSSYYTGNGWHATVKEYTLQDMQIDTIVVNQASSKLVQLGEQKAALLNLDIQTIGTLNTLMFNAFSLNMKGTEANIETLYLMQGENVLAQAEAAAEVTLTLETPVALNEYNNVFTIAADIKADAMVESFVDAALSSVTLSNNTQTVTAGDPDGARTVKNVRLMQVGDNGTVTIGENSLILYDDGGAEENYSANFEGYITFVPASEGCAIELIFKDFDIAYLSGDPFHIYYANAYDTEATSDKKYGMYSKPSENESVISRAEDGAITIYVKMPSSRMRGFEVEVRQHLLTDLAVDSVLVTPMAPVEATKGTGDIRLMQAAVYVSGDRNPLTITNFEQTVSEILIDRHIYATGHSTTFSTTTEFTDSYVMDENGVYYFWFVGSIDENAEIGTVASLALNNVVLGDQPIAPQGNAAIAINVVSGAHGFYRVGASELADYATLGAALQAISNIGMDGAVEIAIEPGTYTEQVTIAAINGAGAANTLTIRSLSGNYNDVTYQYNNTLSSEQGVFTINGGDYVTIKGLSFTSSYTSNQSPAIVIVRNAATHVTIDSCRIYTEQMSEYTTRLDLLYVDAGENNYNNDFVLTNSVLDGGYMGLRVAGHKAAADPLQQNMLISHNTFRNQGCQMLYGDAVSNLQVLNNTFRTAVKKSSCAAIDWLLIGDTATIAGNDIYLTAAASDDLNYQAVYFRPNSYQDKENAVLYMVNNVIHAANESTYASYALNLNSNLPKLLVAYNTIVLDAEGTAASPVYIQSAPAEGSLFVNNIIQASNKGYAIRYRNAAAIANIAFRHNVLYTPEETFGMPTSSISTFADWKSAAGVSEEDGNINEAVNFASATLLFPHETNNGQLLTAEVLEAVTTDITGQTRAATPTIGAYEYNADLFRVPEMVEGYPTVNVQDVKADIIIKTDNYGIAKVMVLPAEAEAPSLETLAEATDELTLIKNGEVSFSASDLTEETAYKVYMLLFSPLGEAAEQYQEIAFTTAWTLRPVVLNPIDKQIVAAGTECTLTATVYTEYEQVKPYSYAWRTAYSDALIGTEATLALTADTTTEYICLVTDKFGQKALLSAHVWVEKDAAVATFEEYSLAENGHKYVDEAWQDNTETYLYSGTYAFGNVPNKAYNAFNGYAICSDQSTEATGYYTIDQFRSAAGGAYEGNNFAIAYYAAPSTWFTGYSDPLTLTNSTEPQVLTGFYITNTVYTLDAILHGDYANDPFSTGDYMSVTAIGYNGSEKTGETVFYLADYRSVNTEEQFAVDTWQWFDLTSLGAVTRVEFELFTTKSDEYGFTTPTYFCLDNLGAESPVTIGLEEVQSESVPCTKLLINGTLYILRGEQIYDINGRLVEK